MLVLLLQIAVFTILYARQRSATPVYYLAILFGRCHSTGSQNAKRTYQVQHSYFV